MLPVKGNVLAWSAPAGKWVKVNVRYVKENPTVYPQWKKIEAELPPPPADPEPSVPASAGWCIECGRTLGLMGGKLPKHRPFGERYRAMGWCPGSKRFPSPPGSSKLQW